MHLHCNEGSSKLAYTWFTDLQFPSSLYAFIKGIVVGANMSLAQYSGFKAIDSLIFAHVVRALRFKL